jgi:hypothetical protein
MPLFLFWKESILSNQYRMRVMMRARPRLEFEHLGQGTKLTAQSFQAIRDLLDLSCVDVANIGHEVGNLDSMSIHI